MNFATRLKSIQPSTTLEITAKANAMKAAGHPVISFAAGEPEFSPPQHLQNKTIEAIQQGHNHYLSALGLPELRKAIAEKYRLETQLPYTLEEVVVSNGAKHVIYNAIQVLCEAGDEVLIPSPYWLSYPEQVRLAEATPVFVPTEEKDRFQVSVAQLEQYYTPKTKLLILNSPSNPTGSIYSKERLHEISQWLLAHPHVFVLFDEIYEKLLYDQRTHCNLLHVEPTLKERCLLVNGFSKSHAITGWRLGYGVGPKEWIKQMSTLQSHSTSNAPSLLQYATVDSYLPKNMNFLVELVQEYQERRDLMVEMIHQIPYLSCPKPEGAFYTFPNMEHYLGKTYKTKKVTTIAQFANLLLEEKQVATIPGDAFGSPSYLRLSYTVSRADIQTGMKRIKAFLAEFS